MERGREVAAVSLARVASADVRPPLSVGEQLHRPTQLPLLLPLPDVAQRAHDDGVGAVPDVRAAPPPALHGYRRRRHVSFRTRYRCVPVILACLCVVVYRWTAKKKMTQILDTKCLLNSAYFQLNAFSLLWQQAAMFFITV